MKSTLSIAAIVIAVVAAGVSFFGVKAPVDEGLLGGASGGDFFFPVYAREGFTEGGTVYATTTTAATETLTVGILNKAKVIRFLGSATAAAITVTTPASTTDWIKNPGDYRTWVIENGYTAAATTTTIAAGTGVDLQEPDGQNVVVGINNYAFLTCFREVSTDIVCRVDETIPAD